MSDGTLAGDPDYTDQFNDYKVEDKVTLKEKVIVIPQFGKDCYKASDVVYHKDDVDEVLEDLKVCIQLRKKKLKDDLVRHTKDNTIRKRRLHPALKQVKGRIKELDWFEKKIKEVFG